MSCVVIERLPALDYTAGCVSLGRHYGSPAWQAEPEVLAIHQVVWAALDKLDAAADIRGRIGRRPVVVKPNLVLVYNDIGTEPKTCPETTDPRVLDALIAWLKAKTDSPRLIIAESSGRGAPTRANFRLSGVDRIARRHGCRLYALEEQAAVRYALPRAKVQREILVPELFAKVVSGDYAYISVPKLKTNLYTGVTLGFKNAMGVIPYNLRQRAHHYDIDRKLVEMLYLFKPDLVLIDGVVGGEGECPGPVQPVDSRMIIAGDHAVETDRVATRLMGFDPAAVKLMRCADELGFSLAPDRVRVLGDTTPVAFRPADTSLVSDRVRARFPGIKVLLGIDRGFSQADKARLGRGEAQAGDIAAMEAACRGGCIASTRLGFAMLEAEGCRVERPATLLLGGGFADLEGQRLWYDHTGKSYSQAAIAALPGKKAVIGSCAKGLAGALGGHCHYYVDGCMPLANAPHAVLHSLSATQCRILSAKNRRLPLLVLAILQQRRARIRVLKSGRRLDTDFPYSNQPDSLPEALLGTEQDYVEWPLPPITDKQTLRQLLAEENTLALASITGVIKPGQLPGWREKCKKNRPRRDGFE